MRRLLVILLVALIVLGWSTSMFAAGGEKAERGAKLERGAKNLAFGWTEIPKSIVDTSKSSNALVGITVGTIKGVFQAVARTVSGAVDVATFPVAAYDRPAIKPSMVPESTK